LPRASHGMRNPAVLGPIGDALGLPLSPGGFLFATVHRAENREPAAMAAWAALSERSRAGSHGHPCPSPGTRAALRAEGIALPDGVIVVSLRATEPLWPCNSTPQPSSRTLEAYKREAAWLGVPCLFYERPRNGWRPWARPRVRPCWSGWIQAAATRELAGRALSQNSETRAAERAANLTLAGSGAAERIVAALVNAIGGSAA